MSTEAIIATLLTVIGFLVVAWIGVASMWVREKFTDHGEEIKAHDRRISILERRAEEEKEDREEMLAILRTMRNAG